MQDHDIFSRILRNTLILLGIWGMYAQISVLIGRSFHQLLTGSWLPLLVILFLIFYFRKPALQIKEKSEEGRAMDGGNRTLVLLGLASIAGMLIFRPGNPISALIYVSLVLISLSRIGDSVKTSTVPGENTYNQKQNWIVVVVIVASMIIALCEHR